MPPGTTPEREAELEAMPTAERGRSGDIRRFILEQADDHPQDVAAVAARRFGISRQAVNGHLAALIARGHLAAFGRTRGRSYWLPPLAEATVTVPLAGLDEARVWDAHARPILSGLTGNVREICQRGLTEVLNNAADHSGGTCAEVSVRLDAARVKLFVADDGVGLLRRLADGCGLDGEFEALLELAKGGLTTDPARHRGEGLFFVGRMFDRFSIHSGGWLYLLDAEGGCRAEPRPARAGTAVFMDIRRAAARTARQACAPFMPAPFGGGFSRTRVPVRLAGPEGDPPLSRARARRVAVRLERFRKVELDFAGVETVGEGFVDELFRVWASAHPSVRLAAVNTGPEVRAVIRRAETRS